MEYNVFIPTRGRIGLNRQPTLRNMLAKSKIRPVLVCPPEEEKLHRRYHDRILPCPEYGIGKTRQFIMTNTKKPAVVMVDDDMDFAERRPPDYLSGDLQMQECLDPMFQWVSDKLDEGYVHGGISARQGNQNKEDLEWENGRVNNFHFFKVDTFIGEGCSFDAVPVMEDFYVTLTLLSLGYPNVISYQYCWNQRGSGNEGGCSIYRTLNVQARGADLLHERFPDFVKVVEKESRGGSVFSGTRKDVIIQWRQAVGSRENERKLNVV